MLEKNKKDAKDAELPAAPPKDDEKK